MTLWELGESSGQVSLSGLFEGEFAPSLCEEVGLERMAQLVCRGGWPELRTRSCEDAAEAIDQYLDALFEISVPRKGGETYTVRHAVQDGAPYFLEKPSVSLGVVGSSCYNRRTTM